MHGVLTGAVFQSLDFADKFAHVIKLTVNRDIADVGDGIDVVEFVHDLRADASRGDLVVVVLVKLAEDFIDGSSNDIHGDFPLLAGFHEAAEELLAVDRLPGAIAFDDAEFSALDLLVGGEARSAIQALSTTANRRSVF